MSGAVAIAVLVLVGGMMAYVMMKSMEKDKDGHGF